MGTLRSMKINQLLQAWPRDTVAVSAWLREQNISAKLADQYRRRNWLDSIGHGAFVRKGDNVGWPGAVFALQSLAKRTIHPGGRTALNLLGLAHAVSLGRTTLELFGSPGERLPQWFKDGDWEVSVRFTATALFDPHTQLDFLLREYGGVPVSLSPPERAMLEVLSGVNDEDSYLEAQNLMDGLTTLRPSSVDAHLRACTSVKANRLFLTMAEDAVHAWRNRLTLDGVHLGSGKRQVVRGGRLDTRYAVTIPRTRIGPTSQ